MLADVLLSGPEPMGAVFSGGSWRLFVNPGVSPPDTSVPLLLPPPSAASLEARCLHSSPDVAWCLWSGFPEDLEVRVQMRVISHQEVILGEAGKRVGEDDRDVVGSLAVCDLRQRTSPSPGLQESSGV